MEDLAIHVRAVRAMEDYPDETLTDLSRRLRVSKDRIRSILNPEYGETKLPELRRERRYREKLKT